MNKFLCGQGCFQFPAVSVHQGMQSQNPTVLAFKCEMLLVGSCVRSPAVWKVVEPLESGASLEEVSHWEQTSFPTHSLHPECRHSVTWGLPSLHHTPPSPPWTVDCILSSCKAYEALPFLNCLSRKKVANTSGDFI